VILINQADTTVFDITLTELVTLTNPYYLFVFTNKQTSEVSKVLLSDSSSYPTRYNRFTFTEPTDLTLIAGDYVYKVYEKSVANLTIPAETYLLETGILRVPYSPLTETEFTSTLATSPIVYESTTI